MLIADWGDPLVVVEGLKKLRASKASFRKNSKSSPWKAIRSRARGDVYNRTRIASIFGTEGGSCRF